MTNQAYLRASSRSDLSQWVVYFVRPAAYLAPNQIGNATDIFNNILTQSHIRASQSEHITKYCPFGATCFYDAPPTAWPEIISTNPNARQPLGLIVQKTALWYLGGRPVIYTEQVTPKYWPEDERYRIVHTDLLRQQQPIDWTHEREWRIRGSLNLNQPTIRYTWWWPIVPSEDWLPHIWQAYAGIHTVYVMSRGCSVKRNQTQP
jgi:hypothetical protein